jgi:ATP/maltotriose-dependent transcriptional regulator MalT
MPDSIAYLPRTRLTLPLEAPSLTVLQAPAGYGKSVLLDQWQRDAQSQGQRVARVNLSALHVEPRRLLADLLRVLREAEVALPARLAAEHSLTGRGGSDAAGMLEELALALGKEPAGVIDQSGDRGILLLFDGLEQLSDWGAGLRALVEGAGDRLHLVLAGRARPALPLSRLYVHGAVQEIGVQQLRFTSHEIASYLVAAGVTLADAAALDRIVELTEGWPAGVRLLGDGLRELPACKDISVALTAAWSRIAVFFAEQVLTDAPAQVREFLLRTAPLRQLSAPLCEAVTGAVDAAQLLETCERQGLFVRRTTERSDEFHRHCLFSEYLHVEFCKLPMPEQQRVHGLASGWLFQQGRFEDAFEHAIAADEPERAASILDTCHDWRGSMLGRRFLTLTARLPAPVLERHPRTLLAAAWQAIFAWEFDQAEELLRLCRCVLDQLEQHQGLPEPQLVEFEHLYLHQKMMLALFENDMTRVQQLCDRLMHDYVSANPWIKASVLISLIQANADQYRLRDAESLATRARKLLERSGHPLPQIPLAAAIARVRLISTLDQSSIDELTREVDHALSHRWPEAPTAASMVAIPLAEMHYERNETARASELLDRHLSPVPHFGFLDAWLSGRIVRSRLLHLAGDSIGSIAQLEIKQAWAPEGGLKRLRDFFAADRIRLLLHEGRIAEAVRAGRDSGALAPTEDMLPDRGSASSSKEVQATAFVRLALAQGRFGDALRVCARWRGFLDSAGAVRGVVRWGTLTAAVLLMSGQQRAAQRALRQAIIAAAPGGYLRSILDEGPDIGRLLLDHPQLATDAPEPARAFARSLIAAFEQETCRAAVPPARRGHAAAGNRREAEHSGALEEEQIPPGASLSTREIEMLRMVAAGLMNREVAERLAMTEGSVKWYLHHLYRKLGVTRRTRAINRARELGVVR